MRSKFNRLFGFVRIAKARGKTDFDAAHDGVDASADVFGKGNQEFTGGCVHGEKRRAGLRFAGEENVRLRGRKLEDGAPNEVCYKIFSRGKRDALLERDLDFEPAKFFRVVDGTDAFKVKDAEASVIAIGPKCFQRDRTRGRFAIGEKKLGKRFESFGEIGEKFGGDFAFVAAWAKDARDGDEFWLGGIGHSKKAGMDTSIFVDFERVAFTKFHAACA